VLFRSTRLVAVSAREDEPRPTFLPLYLEADVEPDFGISPAELRFARGGQSKQTVTLSPGRVPGVTVKKAWASQRAFTARVLAGGRKVEVAFDPALWSDDIGVVEVVLETTSVNEPRHHVAVHVDG
jgi:hypothetical protein